MSYHTPTKTPTLPGCGFLALQAMSSASIRIMLLHEDTMLLHEDTMLLHEDTMLLHEDTMLLHEDTMLLHEDTG